MFQGPAFSNKKATVRDETGRFLAAVPEFVATERAQQIAFEQRRAVVLETETGRFTIGPLGNIIDA